MQVRAFYQYGTGTAVRLYLLVGSTGTYDYNCTRCSTGILLLGSLTTSSSYKTQYVCIQQQYRYQCQVGLRLRVPLRYSKPQYGTSQYRQVVGLGSQVRLQYGTIVQYGSTWQYHSMVVPVGGYIVALAVAYGTVPGQQYRQYVVPAICNMIQICHRTMILIPRMFIAV